MQPVIDKVSHSQRFKRSPRLNAYYLVWQGEQVVGSHESHTEEGSPLQVEWLGCERGWEGSKEDDPGQSLDTGAEAGVEAGPVDAEASEAGAQAEAGPDSGDPLAILRVIHDVDVNVEGGDGGQEAWNKR